MAEKKSTAKKPTVKLLDLTPRKDSLGGGVLHSRTPPLFIPPPGFIMPWGERKLN